MKGTKNFDAILIEPRDEPRMFDVSCLDLNLSASSEDLDSILTDQGSNAALYPDLIRVVCSRWMRRIRGELLWKFLTQIVVRLKRWEHEANGKARKYQENDATRFNVV